MRSLLTALFEKPSIGLDLKAHTQKCFIVTFYSELKKLLYRFDIYWNEK
jgi:hypothetical protein